MLCSCDDDDDDDRSGRDETDNTLLLSTARTRFPDAVFTCSSVEASELRMNSSQVFHTGSPFTSQPSTLVCAVAHSEIACAIL